MIFAHKLALENNTRQRMLEIRCRELDYYTGCARNLGTQAALISGMAYSGIRYHYLIERQESYHMTDEGSLEEVMFITLHALTLGFSLQTVFVAMLISMLGPSLALRGSDGSLHDAVLGMQRWNSVTLAMFSLSLLLLQASAPPSLAPATPPSVPHALSPGRTTRLTPPLLGLQLSVFSFMYGHRKTVRSNLDENLSTVLH